MNLYIHNQGWHTDGERKDQQYPVKKQLKCLSCKNLFSCGLHVSLDYCQECRRRLKIKGDVE